MCRGSLLIGVSLLAPRVTPEMVSVTLPESAVVLFEQFDTADPFCRLPRIEMMADKAHRATVWNGEWLAVMMAGEEIVGVEKIIEQKIRSIAAIAVQHHRTGLDIILQIGLNG